jgi:hypothetical protein
MMGTARNVPTSKQLAATCILVCMLAAGCGTSSADQALDGQLKASNGAREAVARFAGKVTIDGQPPAPERNQAVVVILYDPKNPLPPGAPPRYAYCGKEGQFEFHTYSRADGAPVGSYVALFAQLKIGGRGRRGYWAPDALHNLYNDPDKNAQNPEFRIDLAAPGRTDYAFNLAVAGKEPIEQPGPKAVTEIRLH